MVGCGGDIADRMSSRAGPLICQEQAAQADGLGSRVPGIASSCSERAVHVCITKHELATVNCF